MEGHLVSALPYLRAFYEVALCRSFSKAARRLHLSQPAVSRQIKRLETILGVKLFRRDITPVELTPAGLSLFGYVQRSLSLLEEALYALKDESEAVLHVGTPRGYSRTVMPPLLASFQVENPGMRIVLRVESSRRLEEAVLEGELDLAFLARPERRPHLLYLPFREEEMVCIAPPSCSLEGEISVEEITAFPFIIREQGSGTHKVVMEAFERLGKRPKVLVEASSPEFIREWVKAGKGLSIVTASSVEEERRQGRIKVLPLREGLKLDVYVVLLKERRGNPLLQTFLRHLGVG